jgi:hypothetical protein
MSKLFRRYGVAGPIAALAVVAVAVVASVPAMAGPLANSALSLVGVNKTAKKALKVANKANKRAMTPGPQGPAGPKGDAGAAGAQGPAGAAGAAGADGADGADGAPGAPGEPWTAGGTLPSGETETGAWSVGNIPDGGSAREAISFAIPLAAAIPAANIHAVAPSGTAPAGCGTGTVSDPQADAGHLCVYAGGFQNADYITAFAPVGSAVRTLSSAASGSSTAGALVWIAASGGTGTGFGSFAVTAP